MEQALTLLRLNGFLALREVAAAALAAPRVHRALGGVPRRLKKQCLDCARKCASLFKSRCIDCRRRAHPEMAKTLLLQRGCPEGLLHDLPSRPRGLGLVAYDLRELYAAARGVDVRRKSIDKRFRGRPSLKTTLAFLDFLQEKSFEELCGAWTYSIS